METNEASQGNEESNSDSGSQSELILSEVDNPGEGTTNISEEIYKCSDGQVNKAVKYSREVFKGENEKKILFCFMSQKTNFKIKC